MDASWVHAVAFKDWCRPAVGVGLCGALRPHHSAPLILELVYAQLPYQAPQRPCALLRIGTTMPTKYQDN